MNDPADAITLSSVAIDILAEQLALDSFWFPLDIPVHGETDAERRQFADDVRRELTARGLARRGRIDADLDAALRLLARPDSMVTVLATLDGGRMLRARAVANGHLGLIAAQDTENGTVRITTHDPARVFATAIDLIGTAPAHPAAPVTVDSRTGDGPAGFLRHAVDAPARRPRWSADRIWREKRLRAGVFTAVVTDSRGKPHISPEIEWFDTARGRRIVRVSAPHTLICEPATNPAIYRHVIRQLAILRDDL